MDLYLMLVRLIMLILLPVQTVRGRLKFMTEEIKELTRKKLELVENTIKEIELTNDKSRREEWRELKKYQKWAKRVLTD